MMAGEVAEISLMTNSLGMSETARPQDEALRSVLTRAASGDISAFEYIVELYQKRVLSTAWRMLGNREDARDAAQEVFLRTYKYIAGYKLDRDFAGWLYTITLNVCRDHLKKRGRADQVTSLDSELEPGEFDRLACQTDVEAEAIRTQQQALVARAIRTLTKKERAAIVLRDIEGLSTGEVARILGTTQTTVRSHVSSARTKIKQFRDRVLKSGRQG
ncbi:MAG TPA: sigma-70 family RNA polymerase sigma factor [Blastocatellia bacterium]|jgi:RNA polymerase sigma-70 factor (ECF subfamily)